MSSGYRFPGLAPETAAQAARQRIEFSTLLVDPTVRVALPELPAPRHAERNQCNARVMTSPSANTFRVLSLDGGASKGCSSPRCSPSCRKTSNRLPEIDQPRFLNDVISTSSSGVNIETGLLSAAGLVSQPPA
jgi:hypothetical protein